MTTTTIATRSDFKNNLEAYKPNLEKLLASQGLSVDKFMQTAQNLISTIPKLLECDPKSLFAGIMTSAELGLSLSPHSGECYILPYDTKNGMLAQFQLGYKGFVELLYRSGIQSAWAEVVRENDRFSIVKGSDPKIVHEPALSDRGEATGAYACIKINGEVVFEFMNEDEIMAIKAMSKAKNSKYSPWNTNDPQLWMWKKTAFKQLVKTLPKSGNLSKAIQIDNTAEMGGSLSLIHI